MMIFCDYVIDANRVEGRLIGNRENVLQSEQWTEGYQLPRRIGGSRGHGRSGKHEAAPDNLARGNAECPTRADEWIRAAQSRVCSTRSQRRIADGGANQGLPLRRNRRIGIRQQRSASRDQCVDISSLTRSDVSKSLSEGQER